jgi:ubiquitin
MAIYGKKMTGASTRYEVTPADTVDVVKSYVQDETRISPRQQRLTFAGRTLEDGRMLSNFNVKPSYVLHSMRRLSGC